MSAALLSKGFEVEMYTGRPDGAIVGCAAEVAAVLAGFVTEPDQRNLEYITPPDPSYRRQLDLLLEPRRRLRRWLAPRGLTLLPGSTLSTGDSHRFERSEPDNPYHASIEANYGTRVVTASVHINLGIPQMEPLFAVLRLLRCEAAMLLAMSASSPFLDNGATGAHSQRWLQFPLTPVHTPLFTSHAHYIAWMEEQLGSGAMVNVRHLWSSVRPNGDDRPRDLNRVEVRICDLIHDPLLLLAVTAFAELRAQQLLADPARHDPLRTSIFSPDHLAALADANDRAAAYSSLEATLKHWRTGESVLARDWIAAELQELAPLAAELDLAELLEPLQLLLLPLERGGGNTAMRWLARHRAGESVAAILAEEAAALERRERQLEAWLATDAAHALG
jgi:predicted glutamate--cysteine ligase